jgi:hypothetical protein
MNGRMNEHWIQKLPYEATGPLEVANTVGEGPAAQPDPARSAAPSVGPVSHVEVFAPFHLGLESPYLCFLGTGIKD